MGFDSSQIHDLAATLGGVSEKARTLTSQVVRKSGLDVVAHARTLAPVDTGNLKGSIGMDTVTPLEVVAGPTANYGIFQELGTSRHGPQPFMGPALDRVEPGFVAAMGRVAEL